MIENRLNSGLMFLKPEKAYIEEYQNLSSSITAGLVFAFNKIKVGRKRIFGKKNLE